MGSESSCRTTYRCGPALRDRECFIPNVHKYGTDHFPGRKGGTAITIRKNIPPNPVDLPPFVSVEETGV
jgi:hypothetical protein